MKQLSRLFFLAIVMVLLAALPIQAQDREIHDPLEPLNRGIFWFNDKLDVYVLEPVARGYDDVTPERVQRGVGNFFSNLRYPSYLVSDVAQAKFSQAWDHTARFMINTTLGLVGLVDVANEMGFEAHEEDFGIALAYNGVPAGPYLVLPILGPSNLRDGFGRLVDVFLDPAFYLGYTNASSDAKLFIPLGLKAVQLIDTRAGLLEAVETAKKSSLDYYLFIQSAYYQHRRGVLYDGEVPEELTDSEDEPGHELADTAHN